MFTLNRRILNTASWIICYLPLAILGCNQPPEAPPPPAPIPAYAPGFNEEIEFYHQRLATIPNSAIDLAALSNLYFKKAHKADSYQWYLEADSAARQSLIILPYYNVPARLVRAKVAMARHDFAGALEHTDSALVESPQGTEVLATRVRAFLGMGDVSNALSSAERLLSLGALPGSLTLYALALEARGLDLQAERAYQRALRSELLSDQEAAWVHTLYGRHLSRRGLYDDALKEYKKATRLDPTPAFALEEMGNMAESQGDLETAANHFLWAYRFSGDPHTLFQYERVRNILGNSAADLNALADSILAQIRRDADRDSFAHTTDIPDIVVSLGRRDHSSEAVAIMEREASRRRDANTLFLLAQAYLLDDKPQQALRTAREALWTGVRNPDGYCIAARAALAGGDTESARIYYEVALEINSHHEEAQAGSRNVLVPSRPAIIPGLIAILGLISALALVVWSRARCRS